jgi:hypothetical protein
MAMNKTTTKKETALPSIFKKVIKSKFELINLEELQNAGFEYEIKTSEKTGKEYALCTFTAFNTQLSFIVSKGSINEEKSHLMLQENYFDEAKQQFVKKTYKVTDMSKKEDNQYNIDGKDLIEQLNSIL